MKRKIVFYAFVAIHIILILVSLITNQEASAGGFLCCTVLFFEIKNALKPTKPGLGWNPSKVWHNKRGTLKKYRVECIILYVIVFLASAATWLPIK